MCGHGNGKEEDTVEGCVFIFEYMCHDIQGIGEPLAQSLPCGWCIVREAKQAAEALVTCFLWKQIWRRAIIHILAHARMMYIVVQEDECAAHYQVKYCRKFGSCGCNIGRSAQEETGSKTTLQLALRDVEITDNTLLHQKEPHLFHL